MAQDQEIIATPNRPPRVVDKPQEADLSILDFLQRKGIIDPKTIERTTTKFRMKNGKPDNIQGKQIVRDVNIRDEMKKDVENWLIAKGLKEAPEPPPQQVPPELQAIVDAQTKKIKDIANFSPIAQILPPKPGEKFPRVVFNPITTKEKSKLKELGDVIKAGSKGFGKGGMIIPPEYQTAVQAYLDAIPKLATGGYVPSWTSLVLDKIYPGAAEEFNKAPREHLTKELGYEPKRGLAITEDFGEYAGLTPVFRGLGAVGGKVAQKVTSVPILQSLIRGSILGTPLGLARKPYGKDTFLKRLKQVPESVLFFTALDVGALTVGQVFNILKWNKNYSGYAFSGGGRKAGYGPGVKVGPVTKTESFGEVPYTTTRTTTLEAEFTQKDIQALYNKMKSNVAARAAGKPLEPYSDLDQFIMNFVNGSPGWRMAINEGYVKAFGRKPGMMDLFKSPKPFITEPPPASSRGLNAGPEPTPTEPTPTPKGPPQAIGAAPAAPGAPPSPPPPPTRGPVPSTAVGLPASPMGRRMGGVENEERRQAIDSAIAAYKGESSIGEEELDSARAFLEDDNLPSIGGAALQPIQERLGVFKYWAILDIDSADITALAELGDMVASDNNADNPIEWPASITEDGDFIIGDNDPKDLQLTIDRINKGLESSGVKAKVNAGYGTSIEEAEANLINTKTRPVPEVTTSTEVAPPVEERQPIYHFTQPENVNKIFAEGFNTRLRPAFNWSTNPREKRIKPEHGVIYFTRDLEKYKTADIPVGQGKGDKDLKYYNHEKHQWMRVPMGVKTTEMKPIEAFFREGSNILVLDSYEKYAEFVKPAYSKNSLHAAVRKAKRAGYDALEIKNVKGQWDVEGIDKYSSSVGNLGYDDFFVFNRKSLFIPEMSRYRNNKLMNSRAKAQEKRGLPGWHKNAVQLWDDIWNITNGRGLKPIRNEKYGLPMYPDVPEIAEEFSTNVPKFMWNKENGMDVITAQKAWNNLGKTNEQISNQPYDTQQKDLLEALGETIGLDPREERAKRAGNKGAEFFSEPDYQGLEEDAQDKIKPLMAEGETPEAFYDRMETEASDAGFGTDVSGYIDSQIALKDQAEAKKSQGGGEDIPDFALTKEQKDKAFAFGFTIHDLGDHPLEDIPGETRVRMKQDEFMEVPKYVSYSVGVPFGPGVKARIKEIAIGTGDAPEEVFEYLDKTVWKSRADYFLAEDYYWNTPFKEEGVTKVSEEIQQEIEKEILKVREQVELNTKGEPEGTLNEIAPKKEYKIGEEKDIKQEVTADLRYLLNSTTRNLYGQKTGNKVLGEIAVQNSGDATIRAFIKGLIEKGKIEVTFRDGLVHIKDNAEGMSESDIKNFFLRVYGSGKRDEPSIGSFGVGSALVVAVHDQAVFSLKTRDNYIDTNIINGRKGAKTIPFQQGTEITIHWPKVKLSDMPYYDPLINDEGLYQILLNSFPPNEIEFKWKNLDEQGGGKVRSHEFILDRIKGVPKPMEGDEHTKLDAKYYTSHELQKLDKYWEDDLGLNSYQKPSRKLDAKIIFRISHPLMPQAKFVQAIKYVYTGAEFHGALLVDITTDIKAGASDYPLKQDRETLRDHLQQQIDRVLEPLSKDAARAAREAIETTATSVRDLPEWQDELVEANVNPEIKRLNAAIRSTKLADGTPIRPLDLQNLKIKIDNEYTGSREVTQDQLKYLVYYDAILQIVSFESGVPFAGLYPMLSIPINGRVVASQRERLSGAIGLNHTLVNLSEHSHPLDASFNNLRLAVHELAHNAGRDQTPEHEEEMERIFLKAQGRFFDIVKIAQEYTGRRIDAKDIDKIVQVKVPSGPAQVLKSVAKKLPKDQLQLNLDMKEKSGGADPSLYKSLRKQGTKEGENLPVYGERGRGAGRGPLPSYPQRPGSGDIAPIGRGAEQQAPSGVVAAGPRGVGILKGGEGGGIDQALTKAPKGQLGLPMPARYGPVETPPAEPTTTPREFPEEGQAFISRDEFALKQQKERKRVPIVKGEAVTEPVDLEHIQNEVIRLTKAPNFPHHWVGNSRDQIDENIQNLFVYVAQHYKPSMGPVENFINDSKKYFYRGEVPVGQHAKELARRRAEFGDRRVKTDEGEVEIDVANEANVLDEAGESQTKGNLSRMPAPELPDAKEAAYKKQTERIEQAFHDAARAAARVESQAALFKDMEGKRSSLEKMYYQILKRKLDYGDSYRDIAQDLDISHEFVRNIYEDRLLPELRKNPYIKDINDRLARKAFSYLDPEKIKGMEPGFIALDLLVPDFKKMKRFWDKWMSSTRGQSPYIDRQLDMSVGDFHASLFNMAHYAEDYRKWAKKQTPAVLEHIVKAFTGKLTGSKGPFEIRSLHLPPKVEASLLAMRGLTDTMKDLLINLGVPGKLAEATMMANDGKYLERRYQAYEQKRKWDPTPKEEADIINELMTNPLPGAAHAMTREQAQKYIDEVSDFIRTKVRPTKGYEAKKKLIDQHNLLHRNDISPAWRKYLGEYTDLYWLAIDGYKRMASQAANAQFLKNIADQYGAWFPTNKGGIYTKDLNVARTHLNENGKPDSWSAWHVPNDNRYGAFKNTYVPQHFYKYLTEDIPAMISEHERLMDLMITIPSKWADTIGSYPTWVRNVLGDFLMSFVAQKSILDPINWPDYIQALRIILGKHDKFFKEYSDLIKYGFTNTGFFNVDIPPHVREVLNPDKIKNPLDLIFKIYQASAGKGVDALSAGYNIPDQLFRIAGKLINERRGMNIEDNIQDINASFPNYDKNPRIVKALKIIPVLGRFVAFRINMLRIGLSQARIAYQEIHNSSNPKDKIRGMNRLFWLAAVLAGGYVAEEISKKRANVDPEMLEQLKENLPKWQRNKPFAYYRDATGRLKMIDLGTVNPWGEYAEGLHVAFESIKNGKITNKDIESIAEAANFFDSPLFDVIEIGRFNRDPKTGKEYEGFWDQVAAIINEVYVPSSSPFPDLRYVMDGNFGPSAVKYDPNEIDPKTGKPYPIEFEAVDPKTGKLTPYRLNEKGGSLQPGLFTGRQIKNLYDAYNNNPGQLQRIRSLNDDAISMMTGMRGSELDPERILYNAVKSAEYDFNDAANRFRDWLLKHQAYPKEQKEAEMDKLQSKLDKLETRFNDLKELYDKMAKDGFQLRKKH